MSQYVSLERKRAMDLRNNFKNLYQRRLALHVKFAERFFVP